MKQNYTHISVLSDRSGSMENIKKDVEGGFNSFIKGQKEVDGVCTVSLSQFDNEYEQVYSFKNINEVPEFKVEPRGCTALYDGICRLIDSTGSSLALMKEEDKPSKVIFIISTDGFENASREFGLHDVKNRIDNQKSKYNWEFIFLGADQDAVMTARSFGISGQSSMTYNKSMKGVYNLYDSLNKTVASYRSGPTGSSLAFSIEDRLKAME